MKRESVGLARYAKQIPYVDTDPMSKNYFRILDFPQRFNIGKNVFRIIGNSENLVKGSRIYIDIIDVNGNTIYYEVLSSLDSDGSNIIIVWIYEDTPPGICYVYIGGRANKIVETGVSVQHNMDASDNIFYIHVPNVLWLGQCLVAPNTENDKDIVYLKEPIIEYKEKTVPVFTTLNYNRIVDYTSTGSDAVSTTTMQMPNQYSTIPSIQDGMPQVSSNYINPLPSINSNSGESGNPIPIPENGKLAVLRSNNEIFTSDMVGGTIYVYNITGSQFKVGDAPDPRIFQELPDYSASIVNVVNSRTIEVAPPYVQTIEYVSTNTGNTNTLPINGFTNQTDFKVSYARTDINMTSSSRYDTFMSVHIKNLDPLVGSVSKIGLQYKSIGAYGDFNDVGIFPIQDTNLLVDRNSYELTSEDGIHPIDYGDIKNQAKLTTYWLTGSSSNVTQSFYIKKSDTHLRNSMYITSSFPLTKDDYLEVYPRLKNIEVVESSEYVLSFNAMNFNKKIDWSPSLLEVYVSGSSVFTGENSKILSNEPPLMLPELGEYIGSVYYLNGKRGEYEFPFIIKDGEAITPKLVVRAGDWAINDIMVKPRKTKGYTPNQAYMDIPLQDVWSKSELTFKFSYYNDNGAQSSTTSTLYGVVFTGSNKVPSADELTGSSYTNLTIASVDIEKSVSQSYNVSTYTSPQPVRWDSGSGIFNGAFGSGIMSSSYIRVSPGTYMLEWNIIFKGTAVNFEASLLNKDLYVTSMSLYSGSVTSGTPFNLRCRYTATQSANLGLGILNDGTLYIPATTSSLYNSYYTVTLLQK